MISHFPLRNPDSDLSNIKEFELRVLNMEALVTELRLELESLKSKVSEEDIITIEKMRSYQQTVDEVFGLKVAS